jgi:hypothetical protein
VSNLCVNPESTADYQAGGVTSKPDEGAGIGHQNQEGDKIPFRRCRYVFERLFKGKPELVGDK